MRRQSSPTMEPRNTSMMISARSPVPHGAPSPPSPPPPPLSLSRHSMVRVVALNAPDSKLAERRFRSLFSATGAQRTAAAATEGGEADGNREGERAVALCMELVHREGCAVAEEANEILR